MKADQVQPRPWHQRLQALHELQPRHHQVRGAVGPGGLELEHQLPGRVGLHALVGPCRAGDVVAQCRADTRRPAPCSAGGCSSWRLTQSGGSTRSTGVTSLRCAASNKRSGMGNDSTHCGTGRCGMTWSTRCAAVCAMRRAPAASSAWAMKVAAYCCTRRYSVVCYGPWRLWWTGPPSGASWGCRLMACTQGARNGELARS